jgi:hypothetical protein
LVQKKIIKAIILKIIILILNNAVRIPTGIPKMIAEIIESKIDWI